MTERSGESHISHTGHTVTVSTRWDTLSERSYDKASRETLEISRAVESDYLYARQRTSVYNDDGQLTSQSTLKQDPIFGWQNESIVNYTMDAANVLRSYTVAVYRGSYDPAYLYTSTYTNAYTSAESYLDAGQSVSSSGTGAPQAGSTLRSYNANRELISFTDSRNANNSRYFANGANGQALTAVQGNISNVSQAFANALARADNGTRSQYFFTANGQAVGSFGQLQDASGKFKANFDVNYTAVSDEYPSSVPSTVIAQAGDTLRIVAARVFGDGNLWYVLAEANALTSADTELEDGTIIHVPNEVVSLSNSASSFKPFDVREAIGDTSPTQPVPPAPKNQGCGVLGQIIVIVVAIVATYLTAGALSEAGYGAVVSAMGSAAAGSVASQGVAIGIGQQDSFSWKSVATSALTAGILQGTPIGELGSGISSNAFVNGAAQGVINSAVNQGVNIALGLQKSFSWREIAISSVSSGAANVAGQAVGGKIYDQTGSANWARVGSGIAAGVTSALVRRAMGGRMDTDAVLADVFGNALGNSIVDRMSGPVLEEVHPTAKRIGGYDDELQEVQITARRLDANPGPIVNPSAVMTPDEQRNARSRQAVEEVQVTALRRSDPLAGIEEVVTSMPRMTAQEARAYDAREALRMTLGGILTQHRREQDARNMVEAEMTAGQRALVSVGGIMYNGYQSVKSGVVGLADLAVSAYEWDQRVIGDVLHGDLRAAAGEYANAFGLGAEKAKAFLTGAQNLGAVLADAESRQMLMGFAQEYYGTSSQITQSELLGKLPMELLIAAGTAGAGEVISAAGIPQRIGGAINSLADALRTTDVRFPIALDARAISANGVGAIKGLQRPFVRDGGVYVLRDVETGSVVRTGRTNDLVRRQAELARDPALGDYRFEPVFRTNSYAEQRGLEQHVYLKYPDAQLNYIRPISPANRRIDEYMQAATDFLKRIGQ